MTRGVRQWLRGWVGAAISAAASTISTGLSVIVIDPATFNLGEGFLNVVKAVALGAAVSAAIGAAMELKKSPLPPDDDDPPPPAPTTLALH